MANIYYGTCSTGENVENKEVEITSISGDNGVNLINEGDILVILFHHTNKISHPKIRISNADINSNITIENDSGIPIKVRALEVSLSDAWVDGETKFFVFIKGQNNVYYFELIGSVKGDSSTIGNVKVIDWSANINSSDNADNNVALSPYGAQVMLDHTEGLVLNWVGQFSESENNEKLGDLNITKNDQLVTNTIPIYARKVLIPDLTRTSQLWNDGPKPDSSLNNIIGEGNPFLTKYIPGNISFYSTGEHIGLQLVDRNNNTISNPYLIFELADANGNTNMFSKGDITFSAAADHQIVMGGTSQNGRVGNTKINGTLKVRDSAQFDSGFNAKGTSTVTRLAASDWLKMNDHTVLFGRSQIVNITTGDTSVTITDSDIKNNNLPCILCTLQDGLVGVEYVTVSRNNSNFTIHFTKPAPDSRRVRVNYLAFHPDH